MWPATRHELERLQRDLALAASHQPLWRPPSDRPSRVGGVFVATGQPAFAAAAVIAQAHLVDSAVVQGVLEAPYAPGLLALRQGRLLAAAVQQLRDPPDVLLVNASGRDHPRRAGLALHLGAACDLPTIGVTDRPLVATASEAGPLVLDDEVVGYCLVTQSGVKPIIVHVAWRTDAETARAVVLAQAGPARTPEPLRQARRLARTARGLITPPPGGPRSGRSS
jgi:deoxyribonuclease V